ncbi:MAG TPA: C45 family peptidase [Chitinophagaceae bacterium]|nr:C45 family peptidase [Chitinophagaceae bacterium]
MPAGRKLWITTVVFLFFSTDRLLSQSTPAINFIQEKKVPLIELKGNAYERGLQHGRQLENEIKAVFIKWKNSIRTAVKGDPDSTLAAFITVVNFEPVTRKYIPEMLDEVKGIAEGSGQKFSDVFAFQLLDEFWVYLDRQFNVSNHHCSGLAIPAMAGKPAILAQNLDVESYMNGYQVLLHIAATKKEPEQYIVSCAGLVGMNGMNGKGIGVCVNTLMELQASADGLPVAFVVRNILRKEKGKDVLAFLQTVKHASGQNYIIGIADSVYDFEASSTTIVRFIPQRGQGTVVYHTNHALVNHDIKEWYRKYHERVLAGQTGHMNSEVRFASLENRLGKPLESISVDLIKTALGSKDNPVNPVCRPFKEGVGFTFSSVLFTLGGRRSVQLTYGSPDQSGYQEYFFNSPGK